MTNHTFVTAEEYIKGFPIETQKVLRKLQESIRQLIPQGEESISYNIPCFKLNGKYVVYYSGYEHHVSIYPRPHHTDARLAKQITPYISGKGTLKFPLDQPIPYELINQVILSLLAEAKDRLDD